MNCKKPWLIQRCTIKNGYYKEGEFKVSDMLRFDYMGSSEYEWGAVPKCLREMNERMIKEGLEIFKYVSPKNNTKTFHYLCTKNMQEDYVKLFFEPTSNAESPYGRLKELIHLTILLQGQYVIEPKDFDKDDFWIDLENGIAITENPKALENFKLALYSLDELIADWLSENPGKLPSKAYVRELMRWSVEQTKNPSDR